MRGLERAMYKLYWAPGTASMAPQTVLEEAGQPYEMIKLDTAAREHEQPAYKKLNPNGRIPTLVDGDFVIFETAAICQYLCDKHPEAKLTPPAGTKERGRFYQWLTYMTNTVQAGLIDWWHPDFTFPEPATQPAFKQRAEEKLMRNFAVLDAGIGASRWVVGEQYTVCDIYLTMMTRWTRFMAKTAWHFPNIRRVVEAGQARPAFQRMMQKQGIAWPIQWPEPKG
jgi:glutathione S-transferase